MSYMYADRVEQAIEIVETAFERHDDVAVACSFGKDSMVVVDIATSLDPDVPVFAVLPDTEFERTLEFRDRVVEDYDLEYEEYGFEQAPEAYEDVSVCCGEPKVERTREALESYDAWLSGVRRTESSERRGHDYVERDGTPKYNPILDFTETDVWRYLALEGVPVNPVYRDGYRSLGCRLCTSLPEPGESERGGRWRGVDKTECGIHTESI